MRSGRDGAQGRPMNNLIGALQSCSCSPRMGYPGTFGVARTAAACSRLTALSVPSLRSPFSCSHPPAADSLSTRLCIYPGVTMCRVGTGLG